MSPRLVSASSPALEDYGFASKRVSAWRAETMEGMKERDARIFLNMAPEIGPVRFRKLLERFGNARAVVKASERDLAHVPGLPSRVARPLARHLRDPRTLEKELERVEREGVRFLMEADWDYPLPLREIPAAPPLLYIKGKWPLPAAPLIALVGTRTPSPQGLEAAGRLAQGLVERGAVTISGLAKGIDGEVHRRSLRGGGFTVAVLGNGFGHHYPPEHRTLEEEIMQHGALVTEFPFESGPLAEHFPRRNRVISGLSQGVVVVEAPVRSGAMITARFAAEQGRDVWAVPIAAGTLQGEGNALLIEAGARPVECAEQILSEVSEGHAPAFSEVDRAILEQLKDTPVGVDALIDQTGLSAATVASRLLELELQGFVVSHPGKRVSRS